MAALALERVLPAVAKGYGPNEHRKAASKMAENMDKGPGFTPEPYFQPTSKTDAARANILEDPIAMEAVQVLIRSGIRPGVVSDYMNMLSLHELPDDARVLDVSAHGRLIATGECGIGWYLRHGYMWCVKSTTQCDFCGPAAKWKMPEHARAARARGQEGGGE